MVMGGFRNHATTQEIMLKKEGLSIVATRLKGTLVRVQYCCEATDDDGCFRREDLMAQEQAGLVGQCTTSEPRGKVEFVFLEVVRRALAPPSLDLFCITGWHGNTTSIQS